MPRSRRYGWRRASVHRALLALLLIAAPARAAGPLVWALGDSLTAGYGLPPADGFTGQLEGALRDGGVPATVRNGGVSGETSAQGRARLKWGLRGLGARPDLVIVELGANDMLRGLPVAAARDNLEVILAELRRRRIPVLLAGMKASRNMGAEYVAAFDALYPALARKYRVPLYPFFLDGVTGVPGHTLPDGLHPNAAGVAAIVRGILPQVRAVLARPPG